MTMEMFQVGDSTDDKGKYDICVLNIMTKTI